MQWERDRVFSSFLASFHPHIRIIPLLIHPPLIPHTIIFLFYPPKKRQLILLWFPYFFRVMIHFTWMFGNSFLVEAIIRKQNQDLLIKLLCSPHNNSLRIWPYSADVHVHTIYTTLINISYLNQSPQSYTYVYKSLVPHVLLSSYLFSGFGFSLPTNLTHTLYRAMESCIKSMGVLVVVSFLFCCKIWAELERFEQPTKGDGTLTFLVVGDWGRKGHFNQSQVAFQVPDLLRSF